MQTQQIFTTATGSLFFGTATSSVSEKTVDNTFEQMFQVSSEKLDKNSADELKSTSVEHSKSKETIDSKQNLNDSPARKEIQSAQDPTEAEQPADMDEKELAERAAELVAQVTELVKDILNLSTEQLQETMDLFGMKEVDLLNVDLLKQMVLTVNGEQDASAFLMNADLLSQMQQLTKEVEALLAEFGLSREDLMEMLEGQEFAGLFDAALSELANGEDTLTVPEKDAGVQTDAMVTKETEISFQTEVPAEKTEVVGNRNEKGAENGKEQMQEDTQFSNQFLQNLQNAFTEGIRETSLGNELAAQIREIADQILEQVKVMVTPETTSLEIQLTPEHLGKVNITVTEQNGVMKASFVTENELAKEAIESNLIQFKQMMNEQGIRVESIEVTVSEFSFDKNGETSQSGQEEKKHGKTHFAMDEETGSVTMQDELALHFLEGGESTVNYMA